MVGLDDIRFDAQGLIATIVQDDANGEVLMLGYMSRESLEKTLASGRTHFFSRSRGRLWMKGETSGNCQEVTSILLDCDADALLVRVRQRGVACHTGERSCFHRNLSATQQESEQAAAGAREGTPGILEALFEVIRSRRETPQPDSYTSALFERGQAAILKKVGEEASEVIIASIGETPERVIEEVSDLVYHVLVLLAFHQLRLDAVYSELHRRHRPE